MKRFEGRVAVITGASRGIGLAIAERIVSEGGKVVITGRKQAGIDAAIETLGSEYALGVAGSADDIAHQAVTVKAAIESFGRLDVLVNNTGINPAYGQLLDLEPAAAQKIMAVNVVSALLWVQHAHRAWFGEHGGAVVNVASVAGLKPAENIGFYGSSKAALIHLTTQLASELGPQIRVNAVAPAVVKTRFAEALYDGKESDLLKAYPLNRLGTPGDIASAVAYLASDDSSWTTGQVLTVDGGLTLGGGV